MRHNHTRKSSRTLDLYDVVYLDLPDRSETHRIIVPPLKTIYYNRASDPGGIERLFVDVWAFADYIGDERILLL